MQVDCIIDGIFIYIGCDGFGNFYGSQLISWDEVE